MPVAALYHVTNAKVVDVSGRDLSHGYANM